MNWRTDPDLVMAEQERSARGKVIRSAFIWMPLFLISFGSWLFFGFDRIFLDGEFGSTWFLMVVLTIFATLFAFPAVQSVLDLRDGPTEEELNVVRSWSRRDAFVVKNHFLKIESGQILEGNAFAIEGVVDGDRVRARYYPHSAVLIWARRIEDDAGPETPALA
ncbi:MAG: hypothetical protein WD557_00850 [Dehalococcoidia bacterium]